MKKSAREMVRKIEYGGCKVIPNEVGNEDKNVNKVMNDSGTLSKLEGNMKLNRVTPNKRNPKRKNKKLQMSGRRLYCLKRRLCLTVAVQACPWL